jgi:AraC-like DNA-binding protein
MAYSVSTAALRAIGEAARQFGLDLRGGFRATGIDPRLLARNDCQAPFAAVDRLAEYLASGSHCDSFGLCAAEAWRVSDLRSLGLLLQQLPTLRDVLTATVAHHFRVQNSFRVQFHETGDTFLFRVEALAPTSGRQSVEYFLGAVFRIMQSVMGDRWRPISVHTTYPRYESRDAERRLFGERVRFDSPFTGIIGEQRDLDLTLRQYEPEFARVALCLLEQHPPLDGDDVVRQVKDQIHFFMPQNAATLPKVAQAMCMTERSLQRRLSANGVEFSELLNRVRRDTAVRSLANKNIPISEITGQLGYSDASTFGRWFKSQFCDTPAHWRELCCAPPEGGEPTQ